MRENLRRKWRRLAPYQIWAMRWTTDWMTGGVPSVVNKFRPWSMSITASVDFVSVSRRVRRII